MNTPVDVIFDYFNNCEIFEISFLQRKNFIKEFQKENPSLKTLESILNIKLDINSDINSDNIFFEDIEAFFLKKKYLPIFFDYKNILPFSTESIKEIVNPDVEMLDAYGSFPYNEWVVYNTYGDEDYTVNTKNMIFLYSVCAISDERYSIGDILLKDKKVIIENRKDGEFNFFEYKKNEFLGKRAFYFYRDRNQLSLRVSKDFYYSLPKEFQESDSIDWISGPRAIIPV